MTFVRASRFVGCREQLVLRAFVLAPAQSALFLGAEVNAVGARLLEVRGQAARGRAVQRPLPQLARHVLVAPARCPERCRPYGRQVSARAEPDGKAVAGGAERIETGIN